MFAEERQNQIAAMLAVHSSIKVTELSETFRVSESTIRRDLQEMEEKNLHKRTHGGAVGLQKRTFEPSFKEKRAEYFEDKIRIGELAAELVNEGDSVILDTGTTTLEIAKRIKGKRVTVITNGLDIAEELSDVEGLEVILTGGTLRGKTRAMVGYLAENTLRNFKADLAFIGTNGISVDDGITTPNHIEAMTKRAMIASANQVYAVCDASKFNEVSFAVIQPVRGLTGVITSGELSEDIIKSFDEEGVKIIR